MVHQAFTSQRSNYKQRSNLFRGLLNCIMVVVESDVVESDVLKVA